ELRTRIGVPQVGGAGQVRAALVERRDDPQGMPCLAAIRFEIARRALDFGFLVQRHVAGGGRRRGGASGTGQDGENGKGKFHRGGPDIVRQISILCPGWSKLSSLSSGALRPRHAARAITLLPRGSPRR